MDFEQILAITLLFLLPAFIMFLAIVAITRGRKNMKISKQFETTDRKVKTGYWIASLIHMLAGIIIILCLVVVGVIILLIILLGLNLGGE